MKNVIFYVRFWPCVYRHCY